jgi:hypothetical protein
MLGMLVHSMQFLHLRHFSPWPASCFKLPRQTQGRTAMVVVQRVIVQRVVLPSFHSALLLHLTECHRLRIPVTIQLPDARLASISCLIEQ